ncbi:MAG TPA: 3-methyl-2-oxobutanoate hydroxymethyltransferase [Chloroflexi bacterium]|nr:3-methyl-2-oxobutanoate hydroxymethyltransferase [Chloroflexota bacterium]
MEQKKVTILDLKEKKARGEPITMLTAYDYPTGLLVDRAGIDVALVGDSLAMVVLGHENTISVTMEEMLHHCRAVARGARRPLLVGDLPFMSYQVDEREAIRNAGRFLKEGGMDVVKLEGGSELVHTVRAIVEAGIPVMGHIGLTPQTISKLGGYRVQGKDLTAARALIDDAQSLEQAGAFSIILEAIPSPVAQLITQQVGVPTIGIGAGPGCDGQVLVIHDLIGLFDRFVPKFVKQYAKISPIILEALTSYRDEVIAGTFPGPEHGYEVSEEVLTALLKEFGEWR